MLYKIASKRIFTKGFRSPYASANSEANKTTKTVLYQVTILGRWRLDAISIFFVSDGAAAIIARTIKATRNLDAGSIRMKSAT